MAQETFLRIDGFIRNDFTFQKRTCWETPRMLGARATEDPAYTVSILDSNNEQLYLTHPAVTPGVICADSRTAPRLKYLRCYVPLLGGARTLVIQHQGVEIFKERIGQLAPTVHDVKVGVSAASSALRWKSSKNGNAGHSSFAVFFRSSRGKLALLRKGIRSRSVTIQHVAMPLHGRGRFLIVHYCGLRSSGAASTVVEVTPPAPRIEILRPQDNATLPFGQPVDLHAMVHNARTARNGTARIRWKVNGLVLSEQENASVFHTRKSGKHRVEAELVVNGRVVGKDQANIVMSEPSKTFLQYIELVERVAKSLRP